MRILSNWTMHHVPSATILAVETRFLSTTNEYFSTNFFRLNQIGSIFLSVQNVCFTNEIPSYFWSSSSIFLYTSQRFTYACACTHFYLYASNLSDSNPSKISSKASPQKDRRVCPCIFSFPFQHSKSQGVATPDFREHGRGVTWSSFFLASEQQQNAAACSRVVSTRTYDNCI